MQFKHSKTKQFQMNTTTLCPFFLFFLLLALPSLAFEVEEATIEEIQENRENNQVFYRYLIDHYEISIRSFNPTLNAIMEMNPDADSQADNADIHANSGHKGSLLRGIPVLFSDNIATNDKLNTTSGSFALLGSVVPKDAHVVNKLRQAEAVVLGKATMSQWSGFKSNRVPKGWSARGGQGINPYDAKTEVCGASSGAAIAVSANLVTVAVATETNGGIICPSSYNSVVGIRPTVGLTSRAGTIPMSHRQDTVGPIARTVTDAVHVLDTIVGSDDDDLTTAEASQYIPENGYAQYLKEDGLSGKRIGIVPYFFNFSDDTQFNATFEKLFETLKEQNATLVKDLEITDIDIIQDMVYGEELNALLFDFKLELDAYLQNLISSPVRSLQDVITFNLNNMKLEEIDRYGQDYLIIAEFLTLNPYPKGIEVLKNLSRNGFEKVMADNALDALVVPGFKPLSFIAVGGFPAITVPAGYDTTSGTVPFGMAFCGLKGYEPRLIEMAYGFEQVTKVRVKPNVTENSRLNVEKFLKKRFTAATTSI